MTPSFLQKIGVHGIKNGGSICFQKGMKFFDHAKFKTVLWSKIIYLT